MTMVPSGEHSKSPSVATPLSSPGRPEVERMCPACLEGSAATASPPSPTAAAHERLAQILPKSFDGESFDETKQTAQAKVVTVTYPAPLTTRSAVSSALAPATGTRPAVLGASLGNRT